VDGPGGGVRAGLVASLGNVVEWYDFALYTGLATVLTLVLTPGGWDGLLTVFAVFAVSRLFRPIGSLVIGVAAPWVLLALRALPAF
jgi:MHS family proline/betaine transporter-like MFS transporter